MWPFKKKVIEKIDRKEVKDIETPHPEYIKKLNSWINIGDKFKYMGVEFVLIKKFSLACIPIGLYSFISYSHPDVVGEYVDANGVFRQKKFNMNQVDSIMENGNQ